MTGYSAESPDDPETHIDIFQSDDEQFEDLIDMFSDSPNDHSSDIESFGVNEMYGSDSDAEIVCRQPQREEQPPSSNDQSV